MNTLSENETAVCPEEERRGDNNFARAIRQISEDLGFKCRCRRSRGGRGGVVLTLTDYPHHPICFTRKALQEGMKKRRFVNMVNSSIGQVQLHEALVPYLRAQHAAAVAGKKGAA